jgi:hypothetical protein
MKPMSLTILVYQTASRKKPYEKWLDGIKDSSTRFRILARVRQMSVGGLDALILVRAIASTSAWIAMARLSYC